MTASNDWSPCSVNQIQTKSNEGTKERTKRAAEGPSSESEGQKGGITSARGTKGKGPGDPTGKIMGPPPPPLPHPWSAPRRYRCPGGLGVAPIIGKRTNRDPARSRHTGRQPAMAGRGYG